MLNRIQKLYSIAVVLITMASIALMAYLNGTPYRVDTGYLQDGKNYSNEDDREYIGYIFNDYNKKVNLGYADKVSPKPSESDIVNTISLSGLGIENNAESMSRIRSERIIEQRQLEGESQDSRFQP